LRDQLSKMAMDKLFKSDDCLYISPAINLRSFLDEAADSNDRLFDCFTLPGEGAPDDHAFKVLMEQAGCSNGEGVIEEVKSCFASLIDKNPIEDYEFTFPPENSQLKIHSFLQSIREKGASTTKTMLVSRGKYFRHSDETLKSGYPKEGLHPERDLVLTVHLLAPFNKTPEPREKHGFLKRCELRLVVRGQTQLTDIMDRIVCSADLWTNFEEFEPMTREDFNNKGIRFRERFPSRFTFIHDTFYVDQRLSNSRDITENIRAFMDRKKEIGDYQIRDIEGITVADLTLRLGQPYLFQHQGNCEHQMIFTDLHLLTAAEEQSIEKYPLKVYEHLKPINCCTCKETMARYVVTESDRLPVLPAHMCEKCFGMFHYNKEGIRIGDFKAYHYVDKSLLVT